MNGESKQPLHLAITGTLTIAPDQLEQLFSQLRIATAATVVVSPLVSEKLDDSRKLPRLAFSMRETAEILGVSYITVHRLIQRGLLKSSLALRRKMISKVEIERFLKETSRSAF